MGETEDLEKARSLIEEKYLGKAGIHGVGLRRSQSAVTIFLDPRKSQNRDEVIGSIKEEVSPVRVLVFEEEGPSVS